MTMPTIHPIPALQDNYIWQIHHPDLPHCMVVDPGDANVVEHACQSSALTLTGILITHHHWDHTNGLAALCAKRPHIPVYGPAGISGVTHPVTEGDTIPWPTKTHGFSVITVPGHTLDHIAFVGQGIIFCGDTLFAGGCGRLFEGTPAQMFASLNKITALPPNTAIYCTHEYTLNNLAFAQTVEPHNTAITRKIASVQHLRDRGTPSLPSTLEEELNTNPFLRCNEPTVWASAESHAGQKLQDPVAVFAALRQWKDAW